MTPLVSQLWPQFMADPDFAACFGRVVVEHAQMLRQERQVIFTLRSSAPLDKGLCARLLASLAPDYEGFELRINNLFGYATLDEAGLREVMEEMKRDGVPINGFLDRCRITITGQNITVGVCHGTKFLQEMEFERLLADRVAAHTGVRPKVTLTSAVGEAEQRQMEEKLERKIAPPVVKFEKKNTAPSIKVEGLDLTDKPVTIFHGKMFTPKNLTPLKDLGGEGGKCVIWGDVFFTEVKGNYRKIYTVSITDYTGSINLKIRAQEGEDCSKWENIAKGTTLLVRGDCTSTSTTTSSTPTMSCSWSGKSGRTTPRKSGWSFTCIPSCPAWMPSATRAASSSWPTAWDIRPLPSLTMASCMVLSIFTVLQKSMVSSLLLAVKSMLLHVPVLIKCMNWTVNSIIWYCCVKITKVMKI